MADNGEQLRYLQLLSKDFPTIAANASEIIRIEALLRLPKGTEHFMSDLHGEHEAFLHILNNASGVIREKIDLVLGDSVPAHDRAELATLIYYPVQKLPEIKARQTDLDGWYRRTLLQLIELCRLVSSKHTRAHVRKCLPASCAYILDELLHAHFEDHDKDLYYGEIIDSILRYERADAYIIRFCEVIKHLAVDTLHILGDVFDRGARPDLIMDQLIAHHDVDIQWGNHDVVWMGAAAGSAVCVFTVLKTSLAYGNLDLIEQLIENTRGESQQVRIMTKFVEVTQENTEELGFDWIVTPFSVSNDRSTFLGGGTNYGTGSTSDSFTQSPGGVTGWPVNSGSDTINGLVTGGNRTGDYAITKNSVDNLLNSTNRSEASQKNAAPGIMSLTGIYDEGSFQMLMRGLSQKKGSDVLTAPSVTAKSGETAKIEIIREFWYPTEYEPPELPNSVGNSGYNIGYGYGNNGNIVDGLLGNQIQPQISSFPVTPATPGVFEMKPVGVTLEVVPTIGDNKYIIDLNFKPSIVEFEGFVNYGSPIQSTGVGSDGKPMSLTLTENRIEQPIFSKRSVETSLFIYDGHTVAIGGLITENVQTVEDKVPIFGDLPLIGRFFRSNSDNHIKKNLMIFVTGQIIDATGQPVRGNALPTAAAPESALPASEGLLPPM